MIFSFGLGFKAEKNSNKIENSIEMIDINKIKDMNDSIICENIQVSEDVRIAWINMTLNIEMKGLFNSKSISF